MPAPGPYGQPYGPPVTAYPMPPQPPRSGLSRGALIGILAGVVGLVVIVAIVGVAVFLLPRRTGCVVGSWHSTSYTFDLTLSGSVLSSSIAGARVEWTSRGKAIQDFDSAVFTTSSGDDQMHGSVTFDYTIDGNTLRYRNGRGAVFDAAQGDADDSWLVDYTETFQCSGNNLTLHGRTTTDPGDSSEWNVTLVRD